MSTVGPEARLVLFFGTWLVWISALFALRKSRRERAVKIDPRARWGLGLQVAGFMIACTHGPALWNNGIEIWRAIAGVILALLSIAIFWNAVASLGRQWRFDAGLNRDHELVQTGAYAVVRHPIYASMLGMLLVDVCLVGTWPGWIVAVALFLAGTEIRVRVEDGLLRERFGERFEQWRRSKSAYVPFLW
jgi:protein-S-isoprenylcysteine O-methyltransferase Ste14